VSVYFGGCCVLSLTPPLDASRTMGAANEHGPENTIDAKRHYSRHYPTVKISSQTLEPLEWALIDRL
jgi:hypothetical protein